MNFVDTEELGLKDKLEVAKKVIKGDVDKARSSDVSRVKTMNSNSKIKRMVTGFSLSINLLESLNAYAEEHHINKSLLVEVAIREYVERNGLFEIKEDK